VNRILIAAPGTRPSSLVEQSLRVSSYPTEVVRDRTAATRLVREQPFDLVILDLEIHEDDWASTLRDMRAADPRLSVMLVTPRNGPPEKLRALEQEADEYLTRPFGIEELLARVHARLRKRPKRGHRFLRAGAIALDLDTGRADRAGQQADLTEREARLLEVLMRHPEEVMSRERLLSQVWGYDYDPGSNVVAVYVGYLRGKLGAETVETVRGAGYRLRT
jgi:DNA-binding response OmpR family regulator